MFPATASDVPHIPQFLDESAHIAATEAAHRAAKIEVRAAKNAAKLTAFFRRWGGGGLEDAGEGRGEDEDGLGVKTLGGFVLQAYVRRKLSRMLYLGQVCVRCSVLQCGVLWCSVVQCNIVCFSALQVYAWRIGLRALFRAGVCERARASVCLCVWLCACMWVCGHSYDSFN